MPDDLWLAASALADALKETPKLQSLRRAFDLAQDGDEFVSRLNELRARYSALRSYPILLGVRLNQLPATGELLTSRSDQQWLENAVEVGVAFQIIIEGLRSRLPGYPGLRVPHLRDGSPYVFHDPFMVRGFPWDAELRRIGLQLQEPPDMTPLGGDDCRALTNELLRALQLRPSWMRFVAARQALSDDDRRELSELIRHFAAQVDDQAVTEAAGDRLIARFEYRTAVLDEVVSSAQGTVAEYLGAFEAVNELVTVIAAFMQTLLTSEGLLVVEPYRMDIRRGEDLRLIELAIRGDDPTHNAGEVLLVRGPDPAMTGLVYPTAITHKWGRLNEPENARMIVSGKLAPDSGFDSP